MQVNWKKIGTFLLITFGISFTWIYTAYALKFDKQQNLYLIVILSYMLIPALSAIITQYIFKDKIIVPLQIRFKVSYWWVLAWVTPLLIAFAAFGISLFIPGIKYSREMDGMFEVIQNSINSFYPKEKIPELLSKLPEMHADIASRSLLQIYLYLIGIGLLAGLTSNAIAAFGEELGWRGFLMRHLVPLGFWRSSLLIGLVWGVWHAPLILHGYNYPQYPKIGMFMMVAFCIFYTPIICYIRLKSKSVIAAAIMHGTINGTVMVSFAFLSGTNDITRGILGLPGITILAIVTILMTVFIKNPDMNELIN